jgi:hypothetical protein
VKKKPPELGEFTEEEKEQFRTDWMKSGKTGGMQVRPTFYKEQTQSKFKEAVRVIGLCIFILVVCASIPVIVIVISMLFSASKGVKI